MTAYRSRATRRAGHRFSLRTVLLALVALPFVTSLLFSSLWTRERAAVAAGATERATAVGIITDSAELRFSVEIDMLIGYGPISSIDPRGATQEGTGRQRLRARQAFLAEKLLAREEALARLGGPDAVENLQAILDDLQDLWAQPDVVEKLPIHEEIAARLAVLDGTVNSGAPATSSEVAFTLRRFGRLQDLMKDEAETIIEALDPTKRTEAVAARIDFLAQEQRDTLEDLSSVVDEDAMITLRAEAEQAGIQVVRDAIATESGLEDRDITLKEVDLFAMVDVATEWFYSVPRAREAYSLRAVEQANDEVASAASDREVAIAFTISLMLAIAVVTPLVIRSVTMPLRRLADRASVAAAGNLPEPLPLESTTREVAEVADSFQKLNDFLRTVEAQLGALGYGRTEDAALDRRLPGTIGEDIQRSVQRLTATTDQLRASEALSHAIVDAAVDGIWTLSKDLHVLGANAAAEGMADTVAAEVIGRPFGEIHPELAAFLSSGVRRAAEQEFQLHRPAGEVIEALVSVRDVEDAHGTPILTVFIRNVSDRKHLEDRLSHQAHHDHLTGLPNRMALVDEIERALHELDPGKGIGILFLDLDRFKLVNDALGHECGDQLLVAVGDRIQHTLRDGDFVARLGGDEFVIVLRGLPSEELAEQAADRVRTILAQPIDIGGVDEMRVEASIGVAWSDEPHFPARDLLHRADLAMYRAKQAGRARVEIYDSEMQAWASQRNRIEQGLRNALIAGELDAYVQPIMDLQTGAAVGGELLTRWCHQGEWIAPDVFIPLAEESALIGELGKWVLHQACQILAEWERKGWDLYLTVNISGLHLMTGDVDADIVAALAAHPIDPRRLRIEITESFLLGDPDTAISRLTQLRRMGLGIYVDDFGTGYSSLTYLRQLPIDGIKLDRAFVNDIDGPAGDSTIVKLVADLAESLGLSTVAEGIETDTQLEAVREAGYDLGQGWFWAKAMPTDEFAAWIDEHHPVSSNGR